MNGSGHLQVAEIAIRRLYQRFMHSHLEGEFAGAEWWVQVREDTDKRNSQIQPNSCGSSEIPAQVSP